ncbi:MAG: hypothetical protein QM666_04850 [Acinetobacter sp.]
MNDVVNAKECTEQISYEEAKAVVLGDIYRNRFTSTGKQWMENFGTNLPKIEFIQDKSFDDGKGTSWSIYYIISGPKKSEKHFAMYNCNILEYGSDNMSE